MDFIERWFHVSPDNGSGATEVMYVVAVAALIILTSRWRQLAAPAKRCSHRHRKNKEVSS